MKKFRTYSPEMGMLYTTGHYYLEFDGDGEWCMKDEITDYIYAAHNTPGAALMQSTGLQDKNGKEGYQKDIVKGITNAIHSPLGRQEFIGTIEWDKSTDACWYILTQNDTMPYLKFYHVENFEIIGNIHENPDLLK